MYAIGNDNIEIVRAMVNYANIDINNIARDGTSSLILAATKGSAEMVYLLLTVKGIDLDYTDKNGWTALMYANAKFSKQSHVARLLAIQRAIIELESKLTKLTSEKGNIVNQTERHDMLPHVNGRRSGSTKKPIRF